MKTIAIILLIAALVPNAFCSKEVKSDASPDTLVANDGRYKAPKRVVDHSGPMKAKKTVYSSLPMYVRGPTAKVLKTMESQIEEQGSEQEAGKMAASSTKYAGGVVPIDGNQASGTGTQVLTYSEDTTGVQT